MASESKQLHIVLFPFMAHGHMIPTLDIARLFAARDVKATIITTPLNAPTFIRAIDKAKHDNIGHPLINIEVFHFPAKEAGLPEGCENVELAAGPETIGQFFKATVMLREQLEHFLEKIQPTCLVSGMFFPWTVDVAAKFYIPRLVFYGTSFFALCAEDILRRYKPYKSVSSDDEPFVIPSIPHEVVLTRSQVPDHEKQEEENAFTIIFKQMKESELKSFGVIANSFYELELDYVHFFRNDLERKAWSIGPVSLCNRTTEEKAQRGKQASIDKHECLTWLNSKKPNSVIYICFGSTGHTIGPQLREIATALENSNQEFLWVVRNNDRENSAEKWLPPGFEQRMQGKGIVIKGWSPQVLILNHEAVGAFVTHCGWNSTLEGISAGMPMVTWPVFAEQFYNEKLVTQVLKVGVPVGAKKWGMVPSVEDVVKSDAIEKAFREIMVGNEANERRSRVKKLQEMARNALAEGGSSYSQLSALINELRNYQA